MTSLQSPFAQGCVKEPWWARHSRDTTVHNRLCGLAGFPGTEAERNSILLTPYQNLHLCSLSVLGKAIMILLQRSFSGWKGIHTQRDRTRSPDALQGIEGTLGPQRQGQCLMAQAVSRGGGCPGRYWLVHCWKHSTKQARGIYWEKIALLGQEGWTSRSPQIPRNYISIKYLMRSRQQCF